MHAELALKLMGDMLWTSLLVAMPILAVTLVLGVIISVFQVATQIQEQSLSNVPKIIAAVVVLVALGPWMLKRMVAFSIGVISAIPSQF